MSGSTIVASPHRQRLAEGIANRFEGVKVHVVDPSVDPVSTLPESMRLICPKGKVVAEGAHKVLDALKS